MNDTLGLSPRNAAYIMFDNGLTGEQVQAGINTIRIESSGYYLMDDVKRYIKKVKSA